MGQDESLENLPNSPNESLSQISIELLEVGVDSLLSEGIVRDIPVLGTIANLAKAGVAIRDRLFARKVASFLVNLQNISDEQRKNFCQKLRNDSAHQKRLGEILILLLDRLDDLEKPHLLAKIFESYVKGEVVFETFQRAALAIDIAFIGDLKQVIQFDQDEEIYELCLRNLLRSGLSQLASTAPTTPGSIKLGVVLSEVGEIYVKIMQTPEKST
jgi:hypothetical protein